MIKGAISPEKAHHYQKKALDWIQSFDSPLDLKDPSTWTVANLPVQGKANQFSNYSVVHEKFMWNARMEPKILEAFATIWGTDELLVSFDAVNITLPKMQDKAKRPFWPHVDQAPTRRGLHCIQGVLNLSKAGPEDGSLIVLPKSNQVTEEFFETQTDSSTWEARDYRGITTEEMKWFEARGIKPLKVQAEPGDLLLWDSRTVHWGGEPTDKSNTIRTVIYASYSPAALATSETLERKKQAFESYGATTHWAHENVVLRDTVVYLSDGTVDPRNRSKPLEEPEYTEKLLKLAGVKAY